MSITARSVIIRLTTRTPVSGRLQSFRSLIDGDPPDERATCSINTTTRFDPATRSIAPPIPFTILPGIIQFARSPCSLTWSAPRMLTSIFPARIMAKLSCELNMDAPGIAVTVSFPALMRSGSISSSNGNGPIPSMPFSLCNQTSRPAGTWFATRVGRPMPRLT